MESLSQLLKRKNMSDGRWTRQGWKVPPWHTCHELNFHASSMWLRSPPNFGQVMAPVSCQVSSPGDTQGTVRGPGGISHFIYAKVKVTQSCPTLCNPTNYTVHGILQARILEWVAFPFSKGSSKPRDRTQVSRIAGGFLTSWAIREALFIQSYS